MFFPYFCVFIYAPVCLCSHKIDASGQAWESGIFVFECCLFFMLCCKALGQQARPGMVTATPLDLNLFSSEIGQWGLNLCCARIWSLKRKEGKFFFFFFNFIFKLYKIVLVLPNMEMNLPQVLRSGGNAKFDQARKGSGQVLQSWLLLLSKSYTIL